MTRIYLACMIILLLAACNGGYIPLAVATPIAWPSPLPAILSPTPPFIPSVTLAVTIITISPTFTKTSSPTPTEILISTHTPTTTPTTTFTSTPTYILTTTPTQSSNLALDILGCNTSLDILHQMGEVTNAYAVVRNYTGKNLTKVCTTLSASDEARIHPDKTACIDELLAGFQATIKLTVDTGAGQDTAIQVAINSNERITAFASRSSCRDIGVPGWLPDKVGVIEPIP